MKTENFETAILGAGCFWCTEAVFKKLKGVISVEPGYCGGHKGNPTYEEVCSGTTGHAETAKIIFDPEIIGFDKILNVFWEIHDPTTLNRQGNDIGEQYRSVIFYTNEKQKRIALQQISELEKSGKFDKPIVTSVEPANNYYPAENYHKNYYENHKEQPYCAYVIAPKIGKFEKAFPQFIGSKK